MEGKHTAPFWSAGIVNLNDLYVVTSLETTAALKTLMSFSMRSVLMASALVFFLAPYMNRCLVFTPGNPPIIFPPLAVPYMVFLRLLSCLCCFLTYLRGILKTPSSSSCWTEGDGVAGAFSFAAERDSSFTVCKMCLAR